MTIAGWVAFFTLAIMIAIGGMYVWAMCVGSPVWQTIVIIVTVLLIIALLCGMFWYFNNTAKGQRTMIDQKSGFGKGLERTVTVYTANGEVIAQYSGLIDIDTNDGGYVKFDFEGKRYIYYNCFVETIANID